MKSYMTVELLGDRIKKLHKRKKERLRKTGVKFTDYVLSLKLGVSIPMINHWKGNKRRVPEEMIENLASALSCSTDELLEETLQICGQKAYVNFSKVCYHEITESKEFPGLSEEEIQWVLEYKRTKDR
jgi:transcriptional regulator with XRE-family HTH domain